MVYLRVPTAGILSYTSICMLQKAPGRSCALRALRDRPGAALPIILKHFTLPERTSCPIAALAGEPLWTGRCN